ncbi:MAG: hypothetical protein JXB48_11035 [Candidatus Latescibacteria bacterium]|nr:hypothetical protein [Candidatus Latescibacterota bacterium]
MNYIKILLITLFVSCSCQRIDPDLSVSVPELENDESLEQVLYSDSSTVKTDSTPDMSPSQVVQDAKIDSIPGNDTDKSIQKPHKVIYRDKKKPIVNSMTVSSVEKGCSGLSGNPRTTEDAAECSMHHWEIALGLLEKNLIDSAYIHCIRALSLYENGSLFYLKSLLLNLRGNPAAALQAAEISLVRYDHWKISDKDNSIIERCEALTSLYGKYPSSELKEKLKNCFWKY